MTTQPDHATEAAELLACDRADAATAHALLAIHEALVYIAQAMSRPVVNDLRAEVQPPAHPGGYVPDCGIDHETLRASLAQTAARVTKAAAQGEANLAALRAALGHPASPDREDHA